MRTLIYNDEYTIILEENILDDLAELNGNLKNIAKNIKTISLDLGNVKYVKSTFIDYIIKYNEIMKQNNIKVRLMNCAENISELFKATKTDNQIEIDEKRK